MVPTFAESRADYPTETTYGCGRSEEEQVSWLERGEPGRGIERDGLPLGVQFRIRDSWTEPVDLKS